MSVREQGAGRAAGAARLALVHPLHALNRLLSAAVFPWTVRRTRGLEVRGRLRLIGLPLIDIRNGASVVLEDNVLLNSSNFGYHLNMHSRVKLFADRPGARIRIGANSRIHGACVHAYEEIAIGANCLIAANAQIFDGSGHDLSFPEPDRRLDSKGEADPIHIGDSVWIGANALILPGVSIGEGSVIAAGSVVTRDVPPLCVAGGNPARVLKRYEGRAAGVSGEASTSWERDAMEPHS